MKLVIRYITLIATAFADSELDCLRRLDIVTADYL